MTEAQSDPNTPKTDAQLAEEIRFSLAPYLVRMAAILDDAKAKGLRVNWSIAPNMDGKHVASYIDIVRPL